ncbi:MAG: oxidoreductase [Microbacteriaceae bacterium]|nr:oxidoreductase [Microbacteriaceae bacterium]
MRTAVLAAWAAMRGVVDRILGRFTAILVIAALLWLIVVAALVFMLVGALPFDPLAGVVSLLVAVAATLAGAFAAGAAMRARPETESVLVSALLVFLLFTPRLEAPDLIAVAVAGLIAGASRFLVARLGRHVFNPAALGALVVGIVAAILSATGSDALALPTWWVATPPLLPFVAVGALIVAYRSSVLLPVVAYVVVAAAVRLVQFTGFGMPLDLSLGTAFGSLPIVFAAGFMLSEPQTLPGRWWQRLIVAAVAAAVASVPFSIGPVGSTPELGLVLANAIAFAFGLRRLVRLEVVAATPLGERTVELRLRPESPVRHLAGQAVEVAVPHRPRDLRGRRRVFSIVSAPGADELRLAFTVPVHPSSAKTALAALQPGDELTATRVVGDFVAPGLDTEALLVAGGIGITPFLAMIAARDPRADYVLVYRSGEESPPFLDELRRSGVPVILSCPVAPEPLPEGWAWLGPGRFSAESLADALPDLPGRIAYVSGPPAMVAELSAGLRRVGVRRVRRDVFSGA